MRRFPFLQRTGILAGQRKPPTPTAHPCQVRSEHENSDLRGAAVRWLVVAFLAIVVLVNLLKPSPFRYLVAPIGFLFAFLSPATALATGILTILVPSAFGENNIALRLPVLLLMPMAYHALRHLKTPRSLVQRTLLVLQAALCLVIVLVALASESLSEINNYLHIYVGPIALLLATVPVWTISDRRFLFKVFALGSAMVAVKTKLLFASRGPVLADSEDMLRGAVDNLDPNYMSCYIGLGLVCALYLLFETLSSRGRWWMLLVWLAPIGISLLALGQLASRGMALGLVATFAVLVLAVPLKLPARITVFFLVLMVAVGVALSGGFDLLMTRFLKDDVKTGNNRLEINAVALGLFAERPVHQQLFGGGGNSSLRAMGWHTHNAFTEQLMDHGIAGAFCFLGLFLCLGTACAFAKGPVRASGLALLSFTTIASMSVSPFMFAWGWLALACILPCRESDLPSLTTGVRPSSGTAVVLRPQRAPLLPPGPQLHVAPRPTNA